MRKKMDLELAMLMFAGPKPAFVDAVFFHALPDELVDVSKLDSLLFTTVAEKRVRNAIIINGDNGRTVGGSMPGEAWAGFDAWKQRLQSHCKIPIIGTEPPGTQTREEVIGFLGRAREREIKSAFVLSSPAHLVRVMMTYTLEMLERPSARRPRLYPLVAQETEWFRSLRGSLGKPLDHYRAYCLEESTRLDLYQQRRWISTFEELKQYLAWRDSVSLRLNS